MIFTAYKIAVCYRFLTILIVYQILDRNCCCGTLRMHKFATAFSNKTGP